MFWLTQKSLKNLLQTGLCVCSFGSFVYAAPAHLPQEVENKEEAFLVRRIAEFWKDQDYKIVKEQILEFLNTHPKSRINDHLRGILGDIYLQENEYDQALRVYNDIKSAPIVEKIAINKLQCLYELDQFEGMVRFGSPFINKSSDDFENRLDEYNFLMGEAYFRSAAQLEPGAKRSEYLAKAEPLYEKVVHTSFNDATMFALAEIYRLRNENEKASTYFTELSERHPDQREELLFHAGLAQAEFDKKQAIDTFSKVVSKGGLKSQDAALNRLILYYQDGQYANVISSYSGVLQNVEESKKPMLHYMLGRSYFAKEDYKNASTWLKSYAAFNNDPSPEFRNALLMQLNCAQNLHQEALYKETIAQLEGLFPEDAELPQAEFIHAMMLKEKGDFSAAEQKLAALIKANPNFDDQETLYLEYGLVTYNTNTWDKSRKVLSSFLQKFPNSEHTGVAWKYLLSCSLNLLQSAEKGGTTTYSKVDFFNDLSAVLEKDEILTPNEKKECLFLQGKMAYELSRFNDSLNYLTGYLNAYPTDESASEAHLLVALCHNKLNADPEVFCQHAEAALKGNPDLENKSSVHLELYNVYLSLIEKSEKRGESTQVIGGLYQNAAEHLYTAMQLQDLPIKLENRLWLANYYYNECVKVPELYEIDGSLPTGAKLATLTRATSLLESIVQDDSKTGGKVLASFDASHVYLEWETMKTANVYGRMGNFDKKLSTLVALVEQQSKNPNWGWKLKKEALLELAKTYDVMGRTGEAFDTYDFLATNFSKTPTFASEYAYLQTLKLSFEQMGSNAKVEDNTDVVALLNNLKELQIRKSVASEPIHLEAALEYAWVRARVCQENERATRYQFFLNRIKEDFENLSDPMVATYHNDLRQQAGKATLFAVYMQFIDAEIARCEAVNAMKEGKTAQALEMGARAKEMLVEAGQMSDSLYLHQRVKKSLNLLDKAKIA